MEGRHAAVLGFSLGALTVLGVVVLANGSLLSPQLKTARDTAAPSPSPSAEASQTKTGPGPRAGATMVYDAESHGVVLFGGAHTEPQPDGTNPSVSTADTWVWDGRSWRQLQVPGPNARNSGMAAYDSLRHVIVLFGGAGPSGSGAGALLNDTWIWDGARWTEMHPIHVPAGRIRAAFAFDALRGVATMFGGEGDPTTYTETWTWNGTDWNLLSPITSPTTRHFASMAYDAERGQTVLFGGSMPGVRLNDTWIWDGTNWTRDPSPAPGASGFTYMTYDTAVKEVVAYVYFGLDPYPPAEYTISWDGTRWTDRSNASDPSPRSDAAIAYNEAGGQVVLYGGRFDQPQPFAETWLWDGSTWSLSREAAGA
jgi:hypothetical protein